MARIQAFRAIRPNPMVADQLVLTKPQTASVAGEILPPLKTLLETPARLRPETGEGQAAAYEEIKATLASLIENGMLLLEEEPGIYVYEVESPAGKQTGIWALTDLADYRDGAIKTHELTFGDSVRRLKNYRENVGLEGSPVLLAYAPDQRINQLIAQVKRGLPTTLGNPEGVHRLWKIEDGVEINTLIEAFGRVKTVYLADGHHRLNSAAQTSFATVSSLYMAMDELRIRAYHRVVVPEAAVDTLELFGKLLPHFYLQEAVWPVQPAERRRFGLYINGGWYHLLAKPRTYRDKNIAETIDAGLLQNLILAPVFGITDPKSDARLKCFGGVKAIEEIQALVAEQPTVIVFTLCALSAEELKSVADAGAILPPKSTWIDPKVPYGLLLNKHL